MAIKKCKECFTRPVVRKAWISSLHPAPKEKNALEYAQKIKREWIKNESCFKNKIANLARLDIMEIVSYKDEDIRIRKEAKTIVVDSPRYCYISKKGISFDLRICTAICTEGLSTKNWARIGFPYDYKNRISIACSSRRFDKVMLFFNKMVNFSANWAHKRMLNALNKIEISPSGQIEIKVLGVFDRDLYKYYEDLSTSSLRLEKVLTDMKAEKLIRKYFKKIFNPGIPLYEFANKFQNSFWHLMPVNIVNNEHYIEHWDVIYFLRALSNKIQAFGIGYDTSYYGDLAQLSGFKIARLIGKEI